MAIPYLECVYHIPKQESYLDSGTSPVNRDSLLASSRLTGGTDFTNTAGWMVGKSAKGGTRSRYTAASNKAL